MLIKCLPVGHLMTNCYIVTDETTLECAVIDPGDESNTILYYLEEKKWLSKEDLIVVLGGSFGAAKGASFMEIGNVLNLEHKALTNAK